MKAIAVVFNENKVIVEAITTDRGREQYHNATASTDFDIYTTSRETKTFLTNASKHCYRHGVYPELVILLEEKGSVFLGEHNPSALVITSDEAFYFTKNNIERASVRRFNETWQSVIYDVHSEVSKRSAELYNSVRGSNV